MIDSEQEYQDARVQLEDLTAQYKELSAYDRARPYLGKQLSRDIFKLQSDIKQYEYDRFEKFTGASADRR